MLLKNWYIEKQWPHVPAKYWHTSSEWLRVSGNPPPPWYYIRYDFDTLISGCYKGITGPLEKVPKPGDTFLGGYEYLLGSYDNRHDATTKIQSVYRMSKRYRLYVGIKELISNTNIPMDNVFEIFEYV